MLSNLHTHTTFCDGKNTPEEVVLSALEKGFSTIGFSGHCNTFYDLSYCMTDVEGYKEEIKRLKEKYKKEIQVYLGIEEDMWAYAERSDYDYVIGSAHYIKHNSKYFSVDSGVDYVKRCLLEFNNDPLLMAESYYKSFCEYLLKRKPDIAGHFDLLTKYDETKDGGFFLCDKKYLALSEKYLREAIKSEAIFEINAGAVARGYRKTPYPAENLLHILKKEDAKVTISSDAHSADTIDFKFDDMKALLKYIGFQYTYTLYNNEFIKIPI